MIMDKDFGTRKSSHKEGTFFLVVVVVVCVFFLILGRRSPFAFDRFRVFSWRMFDEGSDSRLVGSMDAIADRDSKVAPTHL
jgi:hypothetical protein